MARFAVFVQVHNATRARGLDGVIEKSIAATVPFFIKQGAFEFSVALVGEVTMRRIAKEWKGKDEATDVLSFSFDERDRNGFPREKDGVKHMGEIVICVPIAKEQANESGINLKRNIAMLASHGAIHIFGLDHERSRADYDKTMDIQNKVIQFIKL